MEHVSEAYVKARKGTVQITLTRWDRIQNKEVKIPLDWKWEPEDMRQFACEIIVMAAKTEAKSKD